VRSCFRWRFGPSLWNDVYSAIQIVVALAILMTLLHLGIKGIRLGPSLPAFITPNVLHVLVDNIKSITTPRCGLEGHPRLIISTP